MNRHKRSLTETDDKSNKGKRLIRRNTRVKHYKAVVEYESNLYNEVMNLTIKAIDTKTVASLTPFSDNKRDSIKNNLFTQPINQHTRKVGLSSSQSSELSSKEEQKNQTIFDRLVKIINNEPIYHIKNKKVVSLAKTEEDALGQKYLAQTKQALTDQKNFKKHIVNRMNKTGFSYKSHKPHKSMFDLTQTTYNVLQVTPHTSKNRTHTSLPKKNQKQNFISHFYSRSKKQVLTQKYLGQNVKISPRKYKQQQFTYIDYLSNKKLKTQFLNSHRTVKKYCADLIKNEQRILSIAKYGTKQYDMLKRCLDMALNNFG